MTLLEIAHLFHLMTVAVVVVTTIWILQHHLLRAHILLRLGFVMIAVGAVVEFYGLSSQPCPSGYFAILKPLFENLGQAVVYVWAVTSKRLWKMLAQFNAEHP
jgi:hypothetical protein